MLFFLTNSISAQLAPGRTYKIAVLPFNSDIADGEALKPVYKLFQVFKSMEQFNPVDVQTVLQTLSDNRIGKTTCSDVACARKMGYALRSNFVVHGQINTTYSGYFVALQTTHTKTGRVLNKVTKNVPGDLRDLTNEMVEIGRKLVLSNTTGPLTSSPSAKSSTLNKKSSKKKWTIIGLALAGGVSVGVLAAQGGSSSNPDDTNNPGTKITLPGPPPLSGGN
ncbi:MAG: hypothetical protein DWQ05_17685 [Calditrichaeota bacterium]|nr:MAG: hypothetical protein DWQ05_17685 [Calditrichota bacterium]